MTTALFSRHFRLLCIGAALALAAGCRQNTASPSSRPSDDDQRSARAHQEAIRGTETVILDVVAYYTTPIKWRWNQDRTRVHGVIVGALYLMGPSGKGVFGDGLIQPKLYVRNPTIRDAEKEWVLTKEWEFTPEQMMDMRSLRPTVQGYGYMLPLDWGDLDLSNRQIRIVISYKRSDGMPSPRSSVKNLVVPAKGT